MTDRNPPSEKNGKDGGNRPKGRKPQNDDKFEWRKATRTLTVWILLVIVAWILYQQMKLNDKPEVMKSYSQYQKLLETDQIDAAEIIDHEFHGRLKDGSAILTTLPFLDQDMLDQWDSLRIDYQFKEKTTSWIGYLITSILPWVIIIGFWLYFMRRMQGGGGGQRGLFSFGKSRAKLLVDSTTKVTFDDVAGCDEAKEELSEVIDFLKDPKKFSRLGGRLPKGALLLGPPGTGKTLLARAIAGEAEVPFYSMSGADFVEMFVGVGASRVRDLFEQGKKNAPCIIFIDEIDAVGRHRGAGLGGGHDEREQTLNQLLVEMDGFESNEGVILIAATNRPDVLDPALTRPGRFDRQIVVDRPDVRGREGILKVHARDKPMAPDVHLNILAKGTPGMSGADLANLVNEAALLASRRNANKIFMADFEEAKDKVMMGSERRSMLITDDEKKQTAYHEAGHVLVSKLTPGSDPVHKVTIIPRGRALGLTHYLPIDEKHNYSRGYLNQNLIHLMGGRAAEKLIFNEFSTGAGNDISRATDIARKMVCEWGMSDKIGPVTLGKKNEEVFLGRDFTSQKNFSEKTSQEVDIEIRRIVTKAEQKAERILRDNAKKLHLLADALLDREILDGGEIDTILKGRKLAPLKSHVSELQKFRKKSTDKAEVKSTEPMKSPTPKKSSPVIKKAATSIESPKSVRTTRPTRVNTTRRYVKPPSRRGVVNREGGVVSSRDPGNRRPSPRELARMSDPSDVTKKKSTTLKLKSTTKSKLTSDSLGSKIVKPVPTKASIPTKPKVTTPVKSVPAKVAKTTTVKIKAPSKKSQPKPLPPKPKTVKPTRVEKKSENVNISLNEKKIRESLDRLGKQDPKSGN